MKRIKFGGKDLLGRESRDNYPTDDKHMLLSYFLDDIEYTIQEVIEQLESVRDEEKTFDEIKDHPQVVWDFGNGSGHFECDKDKAYFLAQDEDFQDIEMPLQELIDILYEWKAFLGK